MNDVEIPEVDRQDGTNHPRHTKILYGHKTSQLDFLMLSTQIGCITLTD